MQPLTLEVQLVCDIVATCHVCRNGFAMGPLDLDSQAGLREMQHAVSHPHLSHIRHVVSLQHGPTENGSRCTETEASEATSCLTSPSFGQLSPAPRQGLLEDQLCWC